VDKYTLDKCSICGKYKALKNNVCIDCEEKTEMPKFFKNLFDREK
jgi:ribosomal protein L32